MVNLINYWAKAPGWNIPALHRNKQTYAPERGASAGVLTRLFRIIGRLIELTPKHLIYRWISP